jgi:probable HAF family extracellular repeat protein
MTFTINRKQGWTVAGTVLLASYVQLFCGAQLYGQQPDIDAAAAAKAAGGLEALTHGPVDSPGPKAVGTFITFDYPGTFGGTSPSSVNPEGKITGSYIDANSIAHGFVRARNGTFTTFDVPGPTSTYPSHISQTGAITGNFIYNNDPNFVAHGFVQTRNGIIITFDAPGSASIGTLPSDINAEGEITGTYYDINFVGHGFFRARNGTLTTFDAPGAGTTGDFPGTYAVGINPEGTIVGMYTDANKATHGFLRTSDGSFTTFDPPDRIAIFSGFSFGLNLYINPEGVITGACFDPDSNKFGGTYRVFVRAPNGTFTTFDAANYPPCCIYSFPSGINPAGAITGSFNDGFSINHGFLRATDGTVTTLDVPGAGAVHNAHPNEGTAPLGITPAGEIMGLYKDANGATHGFLFLPRGDRDDGDDPNDR